MQLKKIDKQLYRSRLNITIVACIAILAISSLVVSQLLIHLFPDPSGSHFHWNLLGVIVSAAGLVTTLIKFKSHPKMYEVAYVWDLKQQLNLIYRKNKQLLAAAEQGNASAMQALHFSYQGSRQLWQLDDNTITMTSLNKAEEKLELWANTHSVSLDIMKYHRDILKAL